MASGRFNRQLFNSPQGAISQARKKRMCGGWGQGWGKVSAPSRGKRKFKRHTGEREAHGWF